MALLIFDCELERRLMVFHKFFVSFPNLHLFIHSFIIVNGFGQISVSHSETFFHHRSD